MDAENRTSDCSGEFPTEKLFPEIVRVVYRNANHRVTGPFQFVHGCVLRRVGCSRQSQMDKQAVAAIDIGLAERFAIYWNQPLPSFPVDSATSCSNQAPRFKIGGDATIVILSRPNSRRHAEDRAEHDAWIFNRNGRHAHTICSVRSRNFATSTPMMAAGPARNRREPPRCWASRERCAAVAFGNLLHFRARICDGEATAGFLRADQSCDTVEEILLENVRLERRARLARDDEERVPQIDFVLESLHLSRIG